MLLARGQCIPISRSYWALTEWGSGPAQACCLWCLPDWLYMKVNSASLIMLWSSTSLANCSCDRYRWESCWVNSVYWEGSWCLHTCIPVPSHVTWALLLHLPDSSFRMCPNSHAVLRSIHALSMVERFHNIHSCIISCIIHELNMLCRFWCSLDEPVLNHAMVCVCVCTWIWRHIASVVLLCTARLDRGLFSFCFPVTRCCCTSWLTQRRWQSCILVVKQTAALLCSCFILPLRQAPSIQAYCGCSIPPSIHIQRKSLTLPTSSRSSFCLQVYWFSAHDGHITGRNPA